VVSPLCLIVLKPKLLPVFPVKISLPVPKFSPLVTDDVPEKCVKFSSVVIFKNSGVSFIIVLKCNS